MWCWFKGWRGWLPLLRFSGAPVFLPVQREKGCRAEHTEPWLAGGRDGPAPLRGAARCSGSIRAQGSAPLPSPLGAKCGTPASSPRWRPSCTPAQGGSGAPRLPQHPIPICKAPPITRTSTPQGAGLPQAFGQKPQAELHQCPARAECSSPPAANQMQRGHTDLPAPEMGSTKSVVGMVPISGSPVCLHNTRSTGLL